MTSPTRQKESRSSRVYAWLLELYPPTFLQRHRAEMLQNFADLEDAAASKSELWLLIGKDLTMSLISHFFASRIGRYVIGVLVAWILLFTIGYSRRGSTPGHPVGRGSTLGHPVLHVFGGFLLGMLSVYIATRFYGVLQNSLYVIGVLVAWILLFATGYSRYGSPLGHPVLHVFGGFLLGMLSMYIATRFYGPRQNNSHA
jgi:hypothetical protein